MNQQLWITEVNQGCTLTTRKLAGFDFDLNDPPESAEFSTTIAAIEERFSCNLPDSFKTFMRNADGGSGFAGSEYAVLWRLSEIIKFNDEYDLESNGPIFVAFGGNGAGEAFSFVRDGSMRIVMIPFMDPTPTNAIPVSNTFDDFFERLSAGVLRALHEV